MRKAIWHSMLATTAVALMLPNTVFAQENQQATATPSDMGEIVVTARRQSENAQNVPISLQAISGKQISDLAITNATELSKLSAGLTITNVTPDSPVITLRGVRWASASGTPAIPIYLNEIPVDPQNSVQSIFDVDQIEVLRGPQGTERGAPSISGAVTITTRRPDLDKIGGYVNALYGEGSHWNAQGAINVPIIEGVLALRVAADLERSDLDRVRSLNSSVDPSYRSTTLRATALFVPTDKLRIQAMYQRRRQLSKAYDMAVGPGSPGYAALGIPANFNGPALTVGDRKSVEDSPNINSNNIDILTTNVTWDVLGQELTYNYGRQWSYNTRNTQVQDFGNVIPGYEVQQSYVNRSRPKFLTNEIRLASVPRAGRFFDYAVGFFQKHSDGVLDLTVPVLLPGALGAPFVTPPGAVTSPINPYVLSANTAIGIGQYYDSFYANVKFHFGSRTELSVGGRHIRDRVPVTLDVATSAAAVVFPRFLPAEAGGCPSPLLPDSPLYGAMFCDVGVPASTSSTPYSNVYKKNIYNVSFSHRFSDEILAYVTSGSSYRSGLPAIGNTGLPANFLAPRPETAKSYEIGLKTNWTDKIRFNIDVFQIDYKDQLTQFSNVPYFNSVSGDISATSAAFFGNVDARVRGVEVDASVSPIQYLVLGANLSYAKIKSQGGNVPCATGPALSASNPINLCASPKGQTLNASPKFQASINGAYSRPIGPVDGYVRFNVAYQGKNPNFGTSDVPTPAYTIVDLFAGITGNDGRWELGLYAKNVFDKQVQLTSQAIVNSVYALFAAPVGYSRVLTTAPREIGVTVRYAFGSR